MGDHDHHGKHGHDHHSHADHGHDHHGHTHDGHDHGHHTATPPSASELRAAALESLLIEKGLVTSEAIDRLVERYENDTGPMIGARVVAHAWVDPAFRQRLLTDSKSALAELGLQMGNLVVVENTSRVHNAVVCTLCSCYPWAVLGLPPTWYKDFAYRSRMVIEPREVLHEFGLDVDDSVELRIWDSSAEQRYLVLPERPEGTEGMSEDELAGLVSRDAMIGVAKAAAPAAVR